MCVCACGRVSAVLARAGSCRRVPVCVGACRRVLARAGLCWRVPACVGACRRTAGRDHSYLSLPALPVGLHRSLSAVLVCVSACRACVGACSSCVGTRVAAYRRGKRVLPLVGACLAGLCASQDPESSSCARPLAGVELWRTRASRAAERCPCGALSTRWALPGSRAVRQSVARTQRPRVAKAVLAGRLSRYAGGLRHPQRSGVWGYKETC